MKTMPEIDNIKTLVFPKNYVWETPASAYPEQKVGKAKIRRVTYNKGLYRMEGVNGFEYYELISPIKITTLQIGKECVMVDDPLHWYGMQALAQHCRGNVLCSGLGLGLIYHALAKNPEVYNVDIIERDADVISLIKPHIPSNFNIIHKDLLNYLIYLERKSKPVYDTAVIDIWWGKSDLKMWVEMDSVKRQIESIYPEAKVYIWGSKDPKINPAVI